MTTYEFSCFTNRPDILDALQKGFAEMGEDAYIMRAMLKPAPPSEMVAYCHPEATVPNFHHEGAFGSMLEGWGKRRAVVAPDRLREYFEPAFDVVEPVTHIRRPKVEAVPGNVKIANRKSRRRAAARKRKARP